MRRFGILAVLTLAGGMLAPAEARAHRLAVECHLLPGQQVRVEGWYSAAGDRQPAEQARVRVLRPDGQLLVEGRLDAAGVFTFSYEQVEPLRVVLAHSGHRAEVTILEEDMSPPVSSSRSEEGWLKDVLLGVSFLLALAAFVLSVRNARLLRRLPESREPSP